MVHQGESDAHGDGVRRSTDALGIRQLTPADAAFMLELLNQPSFHEFIGDRGVRTLEQAVQYLEEGPIATHHEHGFALSAVVRTAQPKMPIGVAGLVMRPGLDHPDLGFALLEPFFGRGFATRAARRVLDEAFRTHRLPRVLAITTTSNSASMRVLEKLGMRLAGKVRLPGDDQELNKFVIDHEDWLS